MQNTNENLPLLPFYKSRQPSTAQPVDKIAKIKIKFNANFPSTDNTTKDQVASNAKWEVGIKGALSVAGLIITADYFYKNAFKLADLILTVHPETNSGLSRIAIIGIVGWGNTLAGIPVNGLFNGASYVEEGEGVFLGWGGKAWKRISKEKYLKALRTSSAIGVNVALTAAAVQGFYLLAKESLGGGNASISTSGNGNEVSIWFWPTNISNAAVAAAGIYEVQLLIEEATAALYKEYYKPRLPRQYSTDNEGDLKLLQLWVRAEVSHLLEQLNTLSNVDNKTFKGWLSHADFIKIDRLFSMFKHKQFATQKSTNMDFSQIFKDVITITEGQKIVPVINRIVATLAITACALLATFGYVLLMVDSIINGDLDLNLKILRGIGVLADAGIVLVFVAQYINSLRKINAFSLAGENEYQKFNYWISWVLWGTSFLTFGSTGLAVYSGALKLWGGCDSALTVCTNTLSADILLPLTAIVTRFINKQASTSLGQSLIQKTGLANGNEELLQSLQFVAFINNLKATLARIIKNYDQLTAEQCIIILKQIAELIPNTANARNVFLRTSINQVSLQGNTTSAVVTQRGYENLLGAQTAGSTPIQQAAAPNPVNYADGYQMT